LKSLIIFTKYHNQLLSPDSLKSEEEISKVQILKLNKKGLSEMTDRDDFLYPRSRYYGEFTPENLVFNANLQEFAQKVSYLCAMETGGKITADQAYKEIKTMYRELKKTRKSLGIGKKKPDDPTPEEPQS
jgi:hypothetical protein